MIGPMCGRYEIENSQNKKKKLCAAALRSIRRSIVSIVLETFCRSHKPNSTEATHLIAKQRTQQQMHMQKKNQTNRRNKTEFFVVVVEKGQPIRYNVRVCDRQCQMVFILANVKDELLCRSI